MDLRVAHPDEVAVDLLELQPVAVEAVAVLAKFTEDVRRGDDHELRECAPAHDPIDLRDDIARELVITRIRELHPVIVGRLLVTASAALTLAALGVLEHRREVSSPRIHDVEDLGQLVTGGMGFVVLADASSRGVDDRDASSHARPVVQAMRPQLQKLAESTGNVNAVAVVAGVVKVFS